MWLVHLTWRSCSLIRGSADSAGGFAHGVTARSPTGLFVHWLIWLCSCCFPGQLCEAQNGKRDVPDVLVKWKNLTNSEHVLSSAGLVFQFEQLFLHLVLIMGLQLCCVTYVIMFSAGI